MASCCCTGVYNTDQRFSFLRESLSLRNWHFDPRLVKQLRAGILPALPLALLLRNFQCFGQNSPVFKIFLDELFLPLNSYI